MFQEAIYLILRALYPSYKVQIKINNLFKQNPHYELQNIVTNISNASYAIYLKIIDIWPISHKYLQTIRNQLAKKIKDSDFLDIIIYLLLNTQYSKHSLTNTHVFIGSHLIYFLLELQYSRIDQYIYDLFSTSNISICNRVFSKNDSRKNYQFNYIKTSQCQKKIYCDKTYFEKEKYFRYSNHVYILLNNDIVYYDMNYLYEDIKHYLAENIGINKNNIQFEIINLKTNKLFCFGYEIFIIKNRVYSQVSTRYLLNLFYKYKFISRKKKLRPISQARLLSKKDFEIVESYNNIWNALLSYYSGVTQQKFKYLYYLLRYSCAMTIAHKHKTNSKKIFQNYNIQIKFVVSKKIKKIYVKSQKIWQLEEYFSDPFLYYD
uniref:Putative reverse transcriptase/maturase n=1 Tax=Bangiopsis subsimplex TaxID=139980 RepID=A0A1Y9TLC9_9RHOD|nr:putative reverse transcriptase/maturase [Bangiopsis subsimplex]